MECELAHLHPATLHVRGHGDHGVLAHGFGAGDVLALACRCQRTAAHRHADLAERHTGGGDGHRIAVAGVEHIHQIGRDGGRRRHNAVFLGEVAADDLSAAVLHLDEACQIEVARAATGELILAVGADPAPADVDAGALGRVHCGHDDLRAELAALHHRAGARDDKRAELVDTDILDVDVGHEIAQRHALGVAHVVLQFAQQGYGCGGRRVLKHVLLPVLAEVARALRYDGGEVMIDHLLLVAVGDHACDTGAIGIDGAVEAASLARGGIEHHICRAFEVVLIAYVEHIAVGAVAVKHYSALQSLGVVVE